MQEHAAGFGIWHVAVEWADPTGVVAAVGALDLNDAGTVVGEELGGLGRDDAEG